MNLNHTYEFLCNLKFNNNRPWFKDHNDEYQTAKSDFATFIDELIPRLKAFDDSIDVNSSKECMFRIFRDVRFSKNKEPYKPNFGAFIAKGGRKSGNAGYYVHFEPDQSFIGGGIYSPESSVLKAIRTRIYENPAAFKKIINSPKFKKYFKGLYGAKLKSAPRGFSKDFEDLALIQHKHYVVTHPVEDEFWFEDNAMEQIVDIFKVQYQFNAYLNEVVME